MYSSKRSGYEVAKIRELLIAASIDTAKRKRICYRNRRAHSIAAGERCLVIKNSGGTGGSRNYCAECAAAILDRAQGDLDALRHGLS
jgi:hypothetical protein